MEKKMYAFYDLIIDVFKHAKIPMSADEIWKKAVEMNFDKKLRSFGKTPSQTVGAKLYTDIKENGDSSMFVQVSKRPARFFLRDLWNQNTQKTQSDIIEKIAEKDDKEAEKKDAGFNERALHPLLVKYAKENSHFGCYTKTIYHEKSTRKQKGENQWLHPDLVGVHFSFDDYRKETTGLQTYMNAARIKLFSFEMKKLLDFGCLRQYFFQAVSNSSWANEGYLVCLDIDEDLKNELQRLSNAFGIGVIKLNPEDINNSEIVCPARFNENIDWDTLDRLAEESEDFRTFLSNLQEDLSLKRVKSKDDYDKVLSDEDYEKYLIEKRII